jgi:hypothetical protein
VKTYNSSRTFQVWDYQVSHKRLLLRSPISPEESWNCDIVFYGVELLNIPTVLRGLEISRDPLNLDDSNGSIPRRAPSPVYKIISCGKSYQIVAVAYKVLRNQLDIFDSGLDSPSNERPISELGEVVSRSEPLPT